MTTIKEFIERSILPLQPTTVCIKTGNAVQPYAEVCRETLATEFSARLFGFLSCNETPYRYWAFA
jgi:hypothetical protein